MASCDEVLGAAGRGLSHGLALATGFVLSGTKAQPGRPGAHGCMGVPEGAPVPVVVVGPSGPPIPGTAEEGHRMGVEGVGEGGQLFREGQSWSVGSAVGRGGAGTDSPSERGELVPLATVGTRWFRALAHTAAPVGLGRRDGAKAGHVIGDGLDIAMRAAEGWTLPQALPHH